MSGPTDRFDPLAFVRRVLVVLLLTMAVVLLHQYAVPGDGFDPRAMLSLGFLILAAYTIGELATTVGIPHITGYLLSGILFGPSLPEMLRTWAPGLRLPPPLDEGIVSRGVLGQLGPIDAFALALIALSAGGELEVDDLKRSLRYVVGSTLGMVVATIGGVFLFLAGLLQLAPQLLPAFAGRPLDASLVLCLVVATLAAATSPAVSIAVVHSTGARGPVASTVLTGVVVGEILLVVLFSATTSVALPILGGVGAVTVGQSVARVAGSAALGLLVGAGVTAYLRLVAVDLLLFLAGTISATTFGVASFGGEPAVAFIAAGLVVGNAHRVVPAAGPDLGRTLLANVERVSRPVFAVFFALAGAKLHLDVLAALAIPAAAIFLVRSGTVWLGTTAGARLSGAPPAVERLAWTGFVSQAGLAIALASQARNVLPDPVDDAVYSLALAFIAVAEMVGPSVLQAGLRAAGEIPVGAPAGRALPEAEGAAPEVGPTPWAQPETAPWPTRPALEDPALDGALASLDAGLQRLIEAEVSAPLEALRRDAEGWVRLLRQQWTRQFRPARWGRLRGADLAHELRASLITALEASKELVRGYDPAFGADGAPFQAGPLVERVDRLVAALPGPRPAAVPASFLAPRPERGVDRLRRAALRVGVRLVGARRSVSLRDLGRYHLSGGLPAALEPVLALLPHARGHVADRVDEIFGALAAVVRNRAEQAERGAATEDVLADLAEDLRGIEERFGALLTELAAIAQDGTERARSALGGAAGALYLDAERAGTFALGSRGPRYAPRFRERSRTTPRLAAAGADARVSVRSRYDELLLALELLTLQVRVEQAAHAGALDLDDRFARRVVAGLAQIDADLDQWIALAGAAIDGASTPADLASRTDQAWSEIRARFDEAIDGVRSVAELLRSERWAAPLLGALNRGLDGLSAAHLLGARALRSDRRALPPASVVSTVPTARRAAALCESRVIQPLRAFGEEIGDEVGEALAAAQDVARVTQFNVDLARAELELVDADAPLSAERREQLRSMLVAAPARTRQRLRHRREALLARDGTLAAAVGERISALQRLDAELRTGQRAGVPPGLRGLPARIGAVGARLRAGLGEDRLLALRRAAGLAGTLARPEMVAALRPPPPRIAVPPVYARLFSDLPFEAGDLVAGRQEELAAVREAIATGLRSAAVVGIDPHGARALVTAALGAGRTPLWFDADGPAEPGTVARWLDPHADGHGQVFVIENLRWLFRRRPGGFAEIEALTQRILRDRGRNQWLLLADGGVWRFLAAATPLRDAMGAAVELDPLTADELARAIQSRHAMSGYATAFRSDEDLVFRAWWTLARGTDAERREAAWLRTLHDAAGGVLQDAMRLWLASVEAVDDDHGQVVLGPVPRPPMAHLAALDDAILLTLLETRRQGWIDPESWAGLFRATTGAAESHLAQLRHLGLLVPHGAVSKLAPHLRGPVERVLGQRGWT